MPAHHIRALLALAKGLKAVFAWMKSGLLFVLNGLASFVARLLRVFTRVFNHNNKLLGRLTRWCYKMGNIGSYTSKWNAHNLSGEVLLIPITFGWILWPLVLPSLLQSFAMYIPCGLLSLFLLKRSWKVVDMNWGEKKPQEIKPPGLVVLVMSDSLQQLLYRQ
jgi:hypothetical protein